MAKLPYKNYNRQRSDLGSIVADILYMMDCPAFAEGTAQNSKRLRTHHYLTPSRDIVNELLVTLRVEEGNKVTQNLRSLYVFMIGQIIEANLKRMLRWWMRS